jgi:hypothetical protein
LLDLQPWVLVSQHYHLQDKSTMTDVHMLHWRKFSSSLGQFFNSRMLQKCASCWRIGANICGAAVEHV